jgi:hypothetical protein
MSAVLIFPLLESVGSLATGFATELGLGATSSSVVGTAVQTGISAQVGNFVDQQAKNIIGQDNVNKINNTVSTAKAFGNDFNALTSGNNASTISYFQNKPKPLIKPNIFNPSSVPTVINNNIFESFATSDSSNGSSNGTQPMSQIQNLEQTPTQTPIVQSDSNNTQLLNQVQILFQFLLSLVLFLMFLFMIQMLQVLLPILLK